MRLRRSPKIHHTARFTSEPVIGEVVTGVAEGIGASGEVTYASPWWGVYDGVVDSRVHRGKVHSFHDGAVGGVPQPFFQFPVENFRPFTEAR